MKRIIEKVTGHSRIDGVVPGVRGQRAFPNSELRTMDPFVMLDHIGPQKMGVDYFVDGAHSAHPHRGFETITFLFEGQMNHFDSLGNEVQLNSGDVQRMNAGSGIIHGGDFLGDPETGNFHEVQLWVNVPASQKMDAPYIQNVKSSEFPEITNENHRIRIISGELLQKKGPIETIAHSQIAHVISTGRSTIAISGIDRSHMAAVYVLKGSFSDQNEKYSLGDFITYKGNENQIELMAEGEGEFLFISGEPIKENVVMGGPFVMSSQQEIEIAYQEFEEGKFGSIRKKEMI